MGKIAGTIIKKDDILNDSLTSVKLNQGFVFIPYNLNEGAKYTDLKPKSEFIELHFNSEDETDNYFSFNVNNSVSNFSFFDKKQFKDFFDKMDIHLMKLGAKKSDKHIIEDLGILKLNDKNIELNIKLKKIKRYNA